VKIESRHRPRKRRVEKGCALRPRLRRISAQGIAFATFQSPAIRSNSKLVECGPDTAPASQMTELA
jgi:hypothetical protein